MPNESEIIARLRKRNRVNTQVRLGIGDDGAVIKPSTGKDLIACCDLMVEGVHFRTDWTSPRLLGHKALAVNLSDVAAMGGNPKFAMMSIALPSWCTSEFIDGLFDGMFELANATGVSIIGGDTSGSPDSLFIDVSVIGECENGKAITRAGAKVGDRIYVSGSLGASALGLSLLENGFRLDESQDVSNPKRKAVLRHLAPEPQSRLGRAIGEETLATAMIDISDGLSTDLWHILDESSVGAVIHADDIPIAECVTVGASKSNSHDGLRLALSGGEDYELLFTAPPASATALTRLGVALGVRLTAIGDIVAAKELQLERNGLFESIPPSGFEHFV
jgi:thiamine-monophosphate kinase